jgi:hypothetical protein
MSSHQQGRKQRSRADWILLFVGLVVGSAFGFWLTPTILYAEKAQPLQFNHKLHLEQVSDSCRSCHYLREDGSFSGIPGLKSCQECHEADSPNGDSPEEAAFLKYLKANKPIPWLVYARQPDCVFFSHAAHTASAGFECSRCHGDHGETTKLRPYEYNRITGYSRDIWGKGPIGLSGPPHRMKMDDCAKCHSENGVNRACFVCHK